MLKQVMLWILGLIKLDELGKNMIEYAGTNLLCFYILFLIILLILVCMIYLLYKKFQKEKVDILVMIPIIIGAFSCSAIYALMDSYTSMCRDYYDEAEELCADNRYQDARVLYSKISDHRDSLEKAAECDYQSARYYFKSREFAEAYQLLFHWLADSEEARDFAVIEDMRQLLENNVEELSSYCEEHGIFLDPAWMLGEWSDDTGNFFQFRIYNDRTNYYTVYRLGDDSWDAHTADRIGYLHGVYWTQNEGDDSKTETFIFCPVSNNSAYVYNFLTGKMFCLER